MSTRKYKLWVLDVLWIVLVLAVAVRWTRLVPWLRLRSLERQVKRYVEPGQLQHWAMGLIARHSGEITHFDQYCWSLEDATNSRSGLQRVEHLSNGNAVLDETTNFPSGLKKVQQFSHGITVLTSGQAQSSVAIFDGSKGPSSFIEVGSPSFAYTNSPTLIRWRPGIFFVE